MAVLAILKIIYAEHILKSIIENYLLSYSVIVTGPKTRTVYTFNVSEE